MEITKAIEIARAEERAIRLPGWEGGTYMVCTGKRFLVFDNGGPMMGERELDIAEVMAKDWEIVPRQTPFQEWLKNYHYIVKNMANPREEHCAHGWNAAIEEVGKINFLINPDSEYMFKLRIEELKEP